MRLILAVTSLAQNSGIRACSQVRSCEAVDVTVNFRDSQHGGDKRKKCQQGCPIACFHVLRIFQYSFSSWTH